LCFLVVVYVIVVVVVVVLAVLSPSLYLCGALVTCPLGGRKTVVKCDRSRPGVCGCAAQIVIRRIITLGTATLATSIGFSVCGLERCCDSTERCAPLLPLLLLLLFWVFWLLLLLLKMMVLLLLYARPPHARADGVVPRQPLSRRQANPQRHAIHHCGLSVRFELSQPGEVHARPGQPANSCCCPPRRLWFASSLVGGGWLAVWRRADAG
jgi:hypothetical protein